MNLEEKTQNGRTETKTNTLEVKPSQAKIKME